MITPNTYNWIISAITHEIIGVIYTQNATSGVYCLPNPTNTANIRKSEVRVNRMEHRCIIIINKPLTPQLGTLRVNKYNCKFLHIKRCG